MGKFSALISVLIFATSIILVAGHSKKEEPVKPVEEMVKDPEPGRKAEHSKPEEAGKASEAPADAKNSQ
jgi:hypothetical protein